MKFLCDVHISYRLVRFLNRQGFEATHVNQLPDRWFTTDNFINQYADENGMTVISKDSDFKNSHFARQTPRRLVRVNLGNISNARLIEIFEQNLPLFETHLAEDVCFIEINDGYINVSK